MAEPSKSTPGDGPPSPWLRNGFVLAATFIGFVAVIAGAVIATSGTPGEDGKPVTARPSGLALPSARPAGGEGSCPELPDRQRKVPTSAPKNTTWALYETVALPSSKESGPAVAGKDGVARCYARTPIGALLATVQISVRYVAADDWLEVARFQTVGAGRDAYIAARTKAEKTEPVDGPGGAQGQVAGFKFVTYNDTTAVIQTVWRFQNGRMQAATTTVLWQDGDWRLEYPADPPDPTPVGSLAGYVEWGGV
ncbi:hypothetical protein [Streptomyces sp. NPDC059850]|uniref:hypothetical protein n=1 Tax=Streptomyces sp. NPDC059850 TaxID=3346970 RepID=UPI00365E186D